jgi:hypothetical protein
MLDHEIGQVSDGVRWINAKFMYYINQKKSDAFMGVTDKKFYNTLSSKFDDVLEKANLYSKDIEGQFHLVDLLSRTYTDEIVPSATQFDVYRTFLNKWRNAFNAFSTLKNNYLNIEKPINYAVRNIKTDSRLLEHAIYNIVNNAIKYSYLNSCIDIKITKNEEGAHIFIISNYGFFLDPKDLSIYERNVRLDTYKSTIIKDIVADDEISNRVVEGKGLGLYFSRLLVNTLGGSIEHSCEYISPYYVPLMRPFFERYKTSWLFRQVWQQLVEQIDMKDEMLPYESIQSEYARLKENNEYTKIVNEWRQYDLKNLGVYRLFDELKNSTYKINFIITIPSNTKEDL